MKPVMGLARKFPNICGIYLDDFIIDAKKQPDGTLMGRPALQPSELKEARANSLLANTRFAAAVTSSSTARSIRIPAAVSLAITPRGRASSDATVRSAVRRGGTGVRS
ncbi:MAG: hypothetical protein N3B01_09215 [Verrucomicrobiae bacterium]|nr:hypothetical protein [Verrucomicrobiae bacterium]